MRPDPELLREGTRLAHLVLLSAAAGLTAERLLRPGLAVRGLALLVGLGGFYAGSWLWALVDWSPGPALLGQPLLPPIVGALGVCLLVKLAAIGAAGPRW